MTYKTSHYSKIILLLFFSCFYLPIINIIWQSFIVNNSLNFSGYLELFADSEILYACLNSFFIAFTTIIISSAITLYAIKYFFLQGQSKIFLIFNLLNLILPETVIAISLLLFFAHFNISLGYTTLIISHVVFVLGYTIPLLYQKWLELDKIYILAAYDLGADDSFVWKTITLQLLKPTIITTSFLSFILSFDDYIFSYFCASIETVTISNPLLSLLKNGLSLKLKALFFCMISFSFLLSVIYLLYVGFNYEK
jgi:spermidine/putrescine transport system permease protein